jgi:hypothetical protein
MVFYHSTMRASVLCFFIMFFNFMAIKELFSLFGESNVFINIFNNNGNKIMLGLKLIHPLNDFQ